VGRELLLSLLIVLLGGLALQPLCWLPAIDLSSASGQPLERRAWLRLWYPVLPALAVAAWLVGWTLTESDPVHDRLGSWVLLAACMPFALIFARAALRALWALLREAPECGVFTSGLLQPLIVFSPLFAKQLDDVVIGAALAHEQAHARHRDPLRIWLAQLVTDLQWPWPWAQRRLGAWLIALELSRDDEARAHGAEGTDLATAVLSSVRQLSHPRGQHSAAFKGTAFAHARLIGDPEVLRERVSRLLAPLPSFALRDIAGDRYRQAAAPALILLVLVAAGVLGVLYGERVMHPLLALTS